jgi:hypothetical protein
MKSQEVGENCKMRSFVTCIIRMIKSRRMIWAGHVAHTRGKGNAKIFWWESQSRKTIIHGHGSHGARNQK